MSVNVSIRMDEGMLQAIDEIAKSLDRDRNSLINEAIKNYLEMHQWQIEQVRRGVADAEAGRTLSHEQVKKRVLERHASAETSLGAADTSVRATKSLSI